MSLARRARRSSPGSRVQRCRNQWSSHWSLRTADSLLPRAVPPRYWRTWLKRWRRRGPFLHFKRSLVLEDAPVGTRAGRRWDARRWWRVERPSQHRRLLGRGAAAAARGRRRGLPHELYTRVACCSWPSRRLVDGFAAAKRPTGQTIYYVIRGEAWSDGHRHPSSSTWQATDHYCVPTAR